MTSAAVANSVGGMAMPSASIGRSVRLGFLHFT
jgi:hypothetical protein